jgi:predicted nucleic acid-binding protein
MIVFDASTLILIAKIDLLEVSLRGIGMEAAIPQAVEAECCGARKSYDSLTIRKALDDSRIKIIPAKDRKLVAKLRDDFSLGKGECEAIAVALREKASLVGIDDREGINACKLIGIPFTTAIAILVRSYEKRLLGQSEALAMLTALAKHAWYRTSFLDDARRRLEEPL